ncbi:MAG TPA: phosphate ABC transporter ATP-binding protein [Phycisphaerae bacterium]|nr:phosphate ABC transporter ATP-binding protein [Phycisphaerae bacterium]
MPDPILKTEAITREVSGRRIVDGITMQAFRGQILAIMGPSGSGKSSFLRLLNRLDEPTAGSVLLDNTDTKSLPPRELRRRVGMVLQSPFLFPGTVADNIAFGPRQRNEEFTPQQIDQLLDHVRLSGYADRDAGRLSGGEAQRVSVARTLANRPDVLLLDEPTSALDANAKNDVERLIARIVIEHNLACIFVTHDPEQTRRMAARLMILVAGKLERIGSTAEVLQMAREIPLGSSHPPNSPSSQR